LKKNDIVICGKGFIGEKLWKALGGRMVTTFIRSYADAEKVVKRHRPRILINAIGYTGKNNVDDCEKDKEGTLTANVFVPIWLAEAAIRRGIKFVHISSGCIYHYDYKKDKPITETRVPDYFDLFYSRTKIYAERALEALDRGPNILIVRIRIPLDNVPHPRNILTKLLRFEKVIDVPNSVTYIPDLIRAFKYLIKKDARGIYNVVNSGGLRYPDLLDVYKKYVPDFGYKVIDYRKLGTARTNLVMSARKLQRFGFKIRPISEVLEECVRTYLKF
jgi:dTDP-4-dehydrorhamnose reductase